MWYSPVFPDSESPSGKRSVHIRLAGVEWLDERGHSVLAEYVNQRHLSRIERLKEIEAPTPSQEAGKEEDTTEDN